MKRLLSLCFACLLLFSSLPALAERTAIPDILRFSQTVSSPEYVREQQYVQCTYPETANQDVNRALRALIDEMTRRAIPSLPRGVIIQMPSYLDTGAEIFRTGSRWMSFLTIARIAYERDQTYVDFDARVYDMESGERITLSDLFAPDSEAWSMLEREARTQLTDYFSFLSPDSQALDALCAREALENAAFTLTPAKLELHYAADTLYPGRHTLMHVKLYYSAIRPLMTPLGQEITDNSMYRMIALTYDDGGARAASNSVMNQLRLHGANATFFIVGNRIGSNHDILTREHDAGYAVASHNYDHVYEGITADKVSSWTRRFNSALDELIGIRPSYMRAPGGYAERFIRAGAGLPMIQWSANSQDSDNKNANAVYANVINAAQDGSVVLMHDLNPISWDYTEKILSGLEERNYLCVTVDELFDHYGIQLEPNHVYYGCEEAAQEQN